MKHRRSNWILWACLVLALTSCTPKVVEPEKDPFVLGSNTIVAVNFEKKASIEIKDANQLSADVLQTTKWVKTTQAIHDASTLKYSFLDKQGYRYNFYKQANGYLGVIKSASYSTDNRYLVPAAVIHDIVAFLADHYALQTPGILDFVKAMWGKDESTTFSIDPDLIAPLLRPAWFTAPTEAADLSRANAEFSLIDELGNLYHFYAQKYDVEVIYAKDNSIKHFYIDFGTIHDVWMNLRNNYADKTITNQLSSTLFTNVYLDQVSTFNAFQLRPLSQKVSDMINRVLLLNKAYQVDVLPDSESTCPFTLKNDQGLYYVICYNPYVVGIGTNPKGTLTYYNLF